MHGTLNIKFENTACNFGVKVSCILNIEATYKSEILVTDTKLRIVTYTPLLL